MSKAFAESCRSPLRVALDDFRHADRARGHAGEENSAIATSGAGPLCDAAVLARRRMQRPRGDGGRRHAPAQQEGATRHFLPRGILVEVGVEHWFTSTVGLTTKPGSYSLRRRAAWSPIHSAAPGWPVLSTSASPGPRKRRLPSSCRRDTAPAAWDWPQSLPESASPVPRGR